tara:strand:+ start:417 stop:941 length:525 start_codon:yes stop_codon:yes gene_type:complete
MAIFLIVFCIWFYSKFFKYVFKLLTFPFRLILAPFKLIKSIFRGSTYKNSPKNQQFLSDTKQRPKKKMGFLKKAVIAGVAAQTARVAHNVANPPAVFVEVPSSKRGDHIYEIRLGSSTPLKNGSGYKVHYTLIRNNPSNPNTDHVMQKYSEVQRSRYGSSYINEFGCKIKIKWS